MSDRYDGFDDLTAEARDSDTAGDSGGMSAIFAVAATLLLGCGLVYAAYKLGERTGVDDIPTLTTDGTPIKEVPLDPGGDPIPNTENDAYRMVDKDKPPRTGYAVRDGIVVSDPLPRRQVGAADPVETAEWRSEIVDVADIAPQTGIEGQPDLTPGEVPDRSTERVLAGGAEVVAPSGDLPPVVPERNAEPPAVPDADANRVVEVGEVDVAVETQVAVLTETTADGLIPPLPRRKPDDFGQRALIRAPGQQVRPEPATGSVRGVRQPQPAQQQRAARPVPQPPVQPTPQRQPQTAVTPQPGRPIPPQPRGDAQVQLSALPSANEVRLRWNELRAANPDLLGRLGLQVLPVRTNDGRQLFRLRAGPLPDGRAAAQLCEQLSYRGIDCFVPARSR